MATTTRVQHNSASGSSASPSVTLAAAPTRGNLLIAFITTINAAGTITLAGWNSFPIQQGGSGGTSRSGQVFYKVAGAAESATVTGSISSTAWAMTVVEYAGARQEVLASSGQLNASGVNTTPSLTPAAGRESLNICFLCVRTSATYSGASVSGANSDTTTQEENPTQANISNVVFDTIAYPTDGAYSGSATPSVAGAGTGHTLIFAAALAAALPQAFTPGRGPIGVPEFPVVLDSATPVSGSEQLLVPSVAGVATVSATLVRQRALSAAVAGVATISAAVEAPFGFPAPALTLPKAFEPGTGPLGVPLRPLRLYAALVQPRELSAAVAGAASVSATVVRCRTLTPSVSGAASVSCTVVRTRARSAAVQGAASVSCTVVRQRVVSPSVSGTAAVSAVLVRSRALSCSVAGAASISCTLVRSRALSCSVAGAASTSTAVERLLPPPPLPRAFEPGLGPLGAPHFAPKFSPQISEYVELYPSISGSASVDCALVVIRPEQGYAAIGKIMEPGPVPLGILRQIQIARPRGVEPLISFFTPTTGFIGTVVTIRGSNFTGALSVAFSGVESSSFSVDSDSQITAVVPSGARTGHISVTTPD